MTERELIRKVRKHAVSLKCNCSNFPFVDLCVRCELIKTIDDGLAKIAKERNVHEAVQLYNAAWEKRKDIVAGIINRDDMKGE